MANSIATSTNALATAYPPSSHVAISASGDVFVLWFDGANVQWSYASSPYTTWTTTTLVPAVGGGPRWEAGLCKLSNDNILVCTANGNADMVSYLFTYGAHAWSVGSPVTVAATSTQYNGGAVPMDVDAQGRVWVYWADSSHVGNIYYTATNGSSWVASTTITQIGGGDDGALSMACCGDYIVCAYVNLSATWTYIRIDAHAASLGSWSAAAAITNAYMDNGAAGICLRGAPGTSYGVFAGDEYTAIPTQYYNAATNTWSAVSTIGASTHDAYPTLVPVGNDLYCLWSAYSAANNYSLVYKKWTSSTQVWDTNPTTLESSGTNLLYVQGAYNASLLGVAYTVGTATPWTVYFDTLSLGVTTTSVSFVESLSCSETFLVTTTEGVETTSSCTSTMQNTADITYRDTLSCTDVSSAYTTYLYTETETGGSSAVCTSLPTVFEVAIPGSSVLQVPGSTMFSAGLSANVQARSTQAVAATTSISLSVFPTLEEVWGVGEVLSFAIGVSNTNALQTIMSLQAVESILTTPVQSAIEALSATAISIEGNQESSVLALSLLDTLLAGITLSSADDLVGGVVTRAEGVLAGSLSSSAASTEFFQQQFIAIEVLLSSAVTTTAVLFTDNVPVQETCVSSQEMLIEAVVVAAEGLLCGVRQESANVLLSGLSSTYSSAFPSSTLLPIGEVSTYATLLQQTVPLVAQEDDLFTSYMLAVDTSPSSTVGGRGVGGVELLSLYVQPLYTEQLLLQELLTADPTHNQPTTISTVSPRVVRLLFQGSGVLVRFPTGLVPCDF